MHRARHAEMVETGTALNVNDEGIWVTYARGMRTKAMREFKELCDEVYRHQSHRPQELTWKLTFLLCSTARGCTA